MTVITHPSTIGAIWMELTNREKLKRRMEKLNVSQRELSRVAGWRSHTYMGRLLNGEERTLNTDPALRIAHHLGFDVEDIFTTNVETPAAQRETGTRRNAA